MTDKYDSYTRSRARWLYAYHLYINGYKLSEIGKRLGVCSERARQLMYSGRHVIEYDEAKKRWDELGI